MQWDRRFRQHESKRRQNPQLTPHRENTIEIDAPDAVLNTRQTKPRNTASLGKLALLQMRKNPHIGDSYANLSP